jgi:hypothetical protein
MDQPTAKPSSWIRGSYLLVAVGWLLSWAILLAPFSLPAAWALNGPPAQSYRCDGEPLTALLVRGAMDEATIADPSSASVPIGGYVVLQWQGISLQLPRTNNAGPASFTDGKWWWSLEDQDHPRFRLRSGLGAIQDFACDRLAAS